MTYFEKILFCSRGNLWIVFYFINSLLFKRKSVENLIQVSTKIFKISNFSFTFLLNEKERVPFNMVWSRKVTRKFLLEGGRGGVLEMFQKRRSMTRKWWRNNRGGGLWPLKETMITSWEWKIIDKYLNFFSCSWMMSFIFFLKKFKHKAQTLLLHEIRLGLSCMQYICFIRWLDCWNW